MSLNSQNRYRNLHKFEKAEIFLASTETTGKLIENFDGEFDYFLATYGSDVLLQKRVPAADGVDATAWRTVLTITDDEDDRTYFIGLNRLYEYQFTTATAGSVIYLAPAWFNGGIAD